MGHADFYGLNDSLARERLEPTVTPVPGNDTPTVPTERPPRSVRGASARTT